MRPQTICPYLLFVAASVCHSAGCGNTAGTAQFGAAGDASGTPTGADATTQSTGNPNQTVTTPPIAAHVVDVWLTTGDLTTMLEQQLALSINADCAVNPNIVAVDTNARLQPYSGLGNAMPDSSAYVIHQGLSAAQQDKLMTALFDPNNGIGLTFLRLPMGASDFSHIGNYSYDDNGGAQDTTLSQFSIAHDLIDIVPVTKRALALNPALKIITTPWSPPAWMKKNTSMISGGDNSLASGMMPVLAQYFVKTVQAYQAQGIVVWGVAPQNEPEYQSGAYPCMWLDAPSEAAFIGDYLGPAFAAAHLNTNILGFDHNWCGQNGGCPAPYATTLAADANAAAYLHGIAWHCYSGHGSDMATFHARNPNVNLFLSECAQGPWLSSSDSPVDYFTAALNLIFDTAQNWAQSTLLWPVALDMNQGPQNSGCSNCRPFANIDSAHDSYTLTPEYYAFGHVSKFLREGAVHIDAADAIAGIHTVAFLNTDQTIVLLAYNTTAAAVTFQVAQGATRFNYSLDAHATATLRWNG